VAADTPIGAALPFDHLVLVNGCPGTGKTWLARRLAPRLGYPLLCRDAIKEAMFDAQPAPPGEEPKAWSQRVGAAAFDVFWSLVPDLAPRAVLEAHFPRRDLTVQALSPLCHQPTEIFLSASPEEVQRRHRVRLESGERHAAHRYYGVPELSEVREALVKWAALGLGGPLLCLDNTSGIDVNAVAAWVAAQAPDPSQARSDGHFRSGQRQRGTGAAPTAAVPEARGRTA
jgi:hypothetical protein